MNCRYRLPLSMTLLLLLLVPAVHGQSPAAQTRAKLWDRYGLPGGNFVRYVDHAHGFSFWRPAAWTESTQAGGSRWFTEHDRKASVGFVAGSIPDGYGVANLASATVQQWRKESVRLDTLSSRHVRLAGLDAREYTFDVEAEPGRILKETVWMAADGPRSYFLYFAFEPEERDKYEPVFKRIVLSARAGLAGHWNKEYEELRSRLSMASLPAERDIEAERIREDLTSAHEPLEKILPRLVRLASGAPDVALDLMTDADPQVRAAASLAFGHIDGPLAAEALLWSLGDKDTYASSIAAQALASRGPAGVAALKARLLTLVDDPARIVSAAAALPEASRQELALALAGSEESQKQLAGLELATAFPLMNLNLPYERLLASTDPAVLNSTIEAIRQRRAIDTVPILSKLLDSENELRVIRALGEVGPSELSTRFETRIKEIDARLAVLMNTDAVASATRRRSNSSTSGRVTVSARILPPSPPPPRPLAEASAKARSKIEVSDTLTASPFSMNVKQFASLPEESRLAFVRGELVVASQKIGFRDRWARAADDKARLAIYNEAVRNPYLRAWAENTLRQPDNLQPGLLVDAAGLADAPATGETLFPKNSTLYLMAPNIEETFQKLDTALSNVQMEGVRDQMIFALLLKSTTMRLEAELNRGGAESPGAALGIDLHSPLALAAWPGQGGAVSNSAMVLRVSDRDRFERTLVRYQQEIGGFRSFASFASGGARLAGILPAAIPLALVGATSISARNAIRKSAERLSSSPVYVRRETIGDLPIVVVESLTTYPTQPSEHQALYVAFLGKTAVIAPSTEALFEVVAKRADGETLRQTEAFAQARREPGELVFFSRPAALLADLMPATGGPDDRLLSDLVKTLSLESGSLHVATSSSETTFHISLSDDQLSQYVQPFKIAQMSAPADLFPGSTVFYAGLCLDPATALGALKSAGLSRKSTAIDSAFDKLLLSKLQGEMSFGVLSFLPLLDNSNDGTPRYVIAFRLKDDELFKAVKSAKLPPGLQLVEGASAFGAPVAMIRGGSHESFLTVSERYLLLADSPETLKRLEQGEKLSSSKDWQLSAAATPESVNFFATYNLDAGFEEVRGTIAHDDVAQMTLGVFSALAHAFHSPRAVLSLSGKTLEGKLAVSFDRAGRLSAGEISNQAAEFDVANALVAPKGLNIDDPQRVDSLRLRLTAGRPEIIGRLRDDLAKFPWQRVESTDDASLVFRVNSRRIPDHQTITLPAEGPELAPYLKPGLRIDSAAPAIVKLAREIAGSDRDGRSVARKLGEWTHQNLTWKRVSTDNLETLASREAACLEHSELYVALARSLGLPARVVTGAAFSGGSFGGHAWVEIYLGKWVEVDPTWGMMDYVDSTHLRFDGNSFASFAMLNQIQLEVVEAREFAADYQRDPIRLVKEWSSATEKKSVFSFPLTVAEALGPAKLSSLDEEQRARATRAFDRAVDAEIADWNELEEAPPRILSSEVKGDHAAILALRGGDLLRVSLAARDGIWYITEVENADNVLGSFSDALNDALQPGTGKLGEILALPFEKAMKELDQRIRVRGENERLLYLEALVLRNRESELALDEIDAAEKREAPKPNSTALLKGITRRWPDFAPAHYLLGTELLADDKTLAGAVAEFQRYAALSPLDPRPWTSMAEAFERLRKYREAEQAYERALSLDPSGYEGQAELAAFYFRRNQIDKAAASFGRALQLAGNPDTAFDSLSCEKFAIDDANDIDGHRRLEQFLSAFSAQVAASSEGLRWLAHAQSEQHNYVAALGTRQRVLALGKPYAADYLEIARLNHKLRSFPAALAALDQALQLSPKYAAAHFERACTLAQQGDLKESVAALKRAVEIDPDLREQLDDVDLKPLKGIPEFVRLREESKDRKESDGNQKRR